MYNTHLQMTHCSRNNTTTTIARLEQCIVDINYWMSANRLKLNMDKTELLWAGTRRSLYGGWQLPIPATWRGYHRTKSTC